MVLALVGSTLLVGGHIAQGAEMVLYLGSGVRQAWVVGNGVAWLAQRGGGGEAYWSLEAGKPLRLAERVDLAGRLAGGGRWLAWVQPGAAGSDLYIMDLVVGRARRLVAPGSYKYGCNTDGSTLVWVDRRNGNDDIYAYDLVGGMETRVTDNPAHQRSPTVSGSIVAWVDYRTGRPRVWYRDLTGGTERPVTTVDSVQTEPAVWGTRIVWTDNRHGNRDIYLYDVGTGEERRLTNNSADQYQPAIWRDVVVWTDRRYGNDDIFIMDLKTGVEQGLAGTSYNEYKPAIGDGRVAFLRQKGDEVEVVLADLAETGAGGQLPEAPEWWVELRIGSAITNTPAGEVIMEVPPRLVDNRTVAPLRFVVEALGGSVQWDPDARAVTARCGGREACVVVGNAQAVVDGLSITMEVSPFLERGRVMVPVRRVAEALGATVEWDGATQTVRLARGGS